MKRVLAAGVIPLLVLVLGGIAPPKLVVGHASAQQAPMALSVAPVVRTATTVVLEFTGVGR